MDENLLDMPEDVTIWLSRCRLMEDAREIFSYIMKDLHCTESEFKELLDNECDRFAGTHST